MTAGVDPKALAASLRRLGQHDEGTLLEQSLRGVVDACVQLFDVAGSGVMLADDSGALHYVVAVDEVSSILEKAEIEHGEGPCVEAYVRDRVVATPDVRKDARWPNLARLLDDGIPIGAVLGVPLHLSGATVGSLDIYVDRPREWDEAEQRAIARYGDVADAMLAAALAAEHAGQLAAQLNYALDYRAPIERGVGYLMARDGVDHATAFNLLRSAARSSRRKIGEVAQSLLQTGRLPGEPLG
jgi:transcriptional regulator with GAF, ATPase, and Fis domain